MEKYSLREEINPDSTKNFHRLTGDKLRECGGCGRQVSKHSRVVRTAPRGFGQVMCTEGAPRLCCVLAYADLPTVNCTFLNAVFVSPEC
jgi:hypothetical protein